MGGVDLYIIVWVGIVLNRTCWRWLTWSTNSVEIKVSCIMSVDDINSPYGPDWAIKPQIVSLHGGRLKRKGKGVMGAREMWGVHEWGGREMPARRLMFFCIINIHQENVKTLIGQSSVFCRLFFFTWWYQLTLPQKMTNAKVVETFTINNHFGAIVLIDRLEQNQLWENDWMTKNLTNNTWLFNCDSRPIKTHQLHYESSFPIRSWPNFQMTNNIAT